MGNEASMPDPKEAPLLRWDFSEDHVYPYDFHQDTVTEHQIDDGFGSFQGQTNTQQMESNGRLSLKSEGNHIARFVLENLTVSMEIDLSDSGEPQTMTSQAPPFVIQGIKEDGRMQLGNSPQELLLRTLFPIPPEPLAMGESVSIPAQMPFNAMGSLLQVTGHLETRLANYVLIDGKTCAKLETDIDISTLNPPEELEGDYRCQVKGKSVFYFNIEDRHFMSGKVAMLMSMRIEAPAPSVDFSGESDTDKMPSMIRMAMDSDNFISVDYIGN